MNIMRHGYVYDTVKRLKVCFVTEEKMVQTLSASEADKIIRAYERGIVVPCFRLYVLHEDETPNIDISSDFVSGSLSMKYRFYGDELQLVRYKLIIGESDDARVIKASTAAEKDELLERYPDAVVTEIDNTGYEWLEGKTFTQEQLRAGELERAIAMGQAAYEEMQSAPPQEEINAMLMLEIAKLKAGGLNE